MSLWPDINDRVYLDFDSTHRGDLIVRCAWCESRDLEPYEVVCPDLWDANNVIIDHQNEHGIFSDPDTGELYYDANEDQYAEETDGLA